MSKPALVIRDGNGAVEFSQGYLDWRLERMREIKASMSPRAWRAAMMIRKWNDEED
jgi:hypothetical protein